VPDHEPHPEVPVEPFGTFARAFAVNGAHIGWLFGAGTSASSGVPTAMQLLDEFKAALYASATGVDRARVTMADPLVAARVRGYFDDANGLPPFGSPEGYAVAFELAYPDAAVRRQCLDRWVSLGRPSFGHRVLAAFMASGHVRWVATTNFDDLVEQGYEQLRSTDQTAQRLTVAALDSAERAARAFREDDWPLVMKLHGDIASERLKNTPAELQQQDETLRSALLDASRQYGLAVIGYSGRDESVMEALRAAVQTTGAFPHGLAWLTSDSETVMPAVRDLLTVAREHGVSARFVETANFDEGFGILARHVELPQELRDHLSAGRPVPRVRLVSLPTVEAGLLPALRFNALPVLDYPRRALRIRCKTSPPPLLRPLLRAVNMPGIGVSSGRDVLAFGVAEGWRRALAEYGPQQVDEIEIDPGAEDADRLVLGLVYDAITHALARDRPLRPLLRRAGHRVVVTVAEDGTVPSELAPLRAAYGEPLSGLLDGGTRRWIEGVRLRLDRQLGQLWLLFEPWTFIEDTTPRTPGEAPAIQRRSRFTPPDPSAAWVKERWATRRNKVWAVALGAWADILVHDAVASIVALDLGDPRAVDARFTLAQQTAYSLPAATQGTTR
jgi:hypothetical protein